MARNRLNIHGSDDVDSNMDQHAIHSAFGLLTGTPCEKKEIAQVKPGSIVISIYKLKIIHILFPAIF